MPSILVDGAMSTGDVFCDKGDSGGAIVHYRGVIGIVLGNAILNPPNYKILLDICGPLESILARIK